MWRLPPKEGKRENRRPIRSRVRFSQPLEEIFTVGKTFAWKNGNLLIRVTILRGKRKGISDIVVVIKRIASKKQDSKTHYWCLSVGEPRRANISLSKRQQGSHVKFCSPDTTAVSPPRFQSFNP